MLYFRLDMIRFCLDVALGCFDDTLYTAGILPFDVATPQEALVLIIKAAAADV